MGQSRYWEDKTLVRCKSLRDGAQTSQGVKGNVTSDSQTTVPLSRNPYVCRQRMCEGHFRCFLLLVHPSTDKDNFLSQRPVMCLRQQLLDSCRWISFPHERLSDEDSITASTLHSNQQNLTVQHKFCSFATSLRSIGFIP